MKRLREETVLGQLVRKSQAPTPRPPPCQLLPGTSPAPGTPQTRRQGDVVHPYGLVQPLRVPCTAEAAVQYSMKSSSRLSVQYAGWVGQQSTALSEEQ